jgi:hypothetical protein
LFLFREEISMKISLLMEGNTPSKLFFNWNFPYWYFPILFYNFNNNHNHIIARFHLL